MFFGLLKNHPVYESKFGSGLLCLLDSMKENHSFYVVYMERQKLLDINSTFTYQQVKNLSQLWEK